MFHHVQITNLIKDRFVKESLAVLLIVKLRQGIIVPIIYVFRQVSVGTIF